MMRSQLRVSDVAREVGLTADAVRYYEKVGLLPAPDRTGGGYRVYDETAVERLRFVRGAQRVGLRLREIAELLEVMDRGRCPCGHTEALLRDRVRELDRELEELTALRSQLVRLIDEHPEGACPDDTSEWWCRAEFSHRGTNKCDHAPTVVARAANGRARAAATDEPPVIVTRR